MGCRQYDRKFFSHVTSRVVVAVTVGQVGHPQLEEVVARLTSWQVAALERHMQVTLLASGRVTLREGGLAVHHAARPSPTQAPSHVQVTADDVWSVFSVDRGPAGSGPPVHVYAALNVGREGWCVLAADFHTLLHVLQEHGMQAPHLQAGQEEACGPDCEGRRDSLVARARAGLRQYPTIRRPRCVRWHKYLVKRTLQLSWMMLAESEEAMVLCDAPLLHYLSHGDPEAGWVLVAGFDVRDRKHRAAGRTAATERPVEVVCEEGDERGFLLGVSPLLRRCGEASRNTFLRHFTQINPLCWEEAEAAVVGEGGLRAAAFRQVCGLPLPYLRQHAPHALYSAISLSRALVPWVAEEHLKAGEDIT
ncbi:uncharacterized protein LOC123512553 [Portunus trituberculatus]|uniref:Uncharacterized protein n=1 Tax=Portunus trituberculatus TaxID=210409 RepID=A0A5B7DUC2_PORTR|nr:uncharacterized protein LOC123512553 [Portunus trituberculatus]MPC25281.1 hypothetical protein [Portunus trituberculatus]